LGDSAVDHVILGIVELLSVWPPPQFFSHEEVGDFDLPNGIRYLKAVKVWHIPGIWMRSDINEYLNAVFIEQLEECLDKLIGEANRVDRHHLELAILK